MKDYAIKFEHVSKIYKLKRKDKEVKKDEKTQFFYALKDLSFQVKKGQVLAIVEAMKLMNEIESDFDGEIAEIYVENGQPVEYGQKLFRIR